MEILRVCSHRSEKSSLFESFETSKNIAQLNVSLRRLERTAGDAPVSVVLTSTARPSVRLAGEVRPQVFLSDPATRNLPSDSNWVAMSANLRLTFEEQLKSCEGFAGFPTPNRLELHRKSMLAFIIWKQVAECLSASVRPALSSNKNRCHCRSRPNHGSRLTKNPQNALTRNRLR